VSVEDVLAAARSGLARLKPYDAAGAMSDGGFLVDVRPEYQRRADGDIPGAVVVERNHLEWRLDPVCDFRIPEATHHGVHWIVICDEGYSSSLAAASLRAIGLVNATDVVGGFQEWRSAGLPVTRHATPVRPCLAPYDVR
jgi:rhodanese-related sulfurtransferase